MTRSKVPVTGVAVVVAVVLAVAVAACGPGTQGVAAVGSGPMGDVGSAAGMCAQDQPDCIDTPQLADDEVVTIDATGIEQLRRDAQFYVGAQQSELNETVRIGRIADEHMALTDDYVTGRITVELDDVDGDVVVTSATVELPDGPETFTLDD